MAELSTIARPYAEAAFRVARSGDLNAWNALVAELAAIAGTAEMRALVLDPNLTPDAIYGVFAGVVKSPLGTEAQNFLRLVIENDRVSALPEVAVQFAALKNKLEGSADAEIASAFPLTDAQVADLTAALARATGKQVEVKVVVDESVLGGLVARVGDTVIDGSLKSRLDSLKQSLLPN